ncbi:sigma-70 family RNA polymerase sigma factor [Rhodopirellula sp. MGV]|uniref:sigma-70 family RNA polymerase sigma factor n=1 Tax=Rhodopirellula sp. MGV TaxID=2023130 RepID=UPI000B961BC5|nr:sigma-70 family RNA polymerase sigma factor [Rhodopirellula sp. MGV]OYP28358.1 RNA polymerase subunit sigma-70 [Rhodopirellula sp. MGV]PNY38766.1 sigma-70 family RNA polymerase sigma factor [Rhodopirellula baltica]
MKTPETRPSLIVRLPNHRDQSAWWAFVELYEPFLRHFAKRRGVPESHLGDATQQILLAIAKSVERFQDDGKQASFRRWLCTVSRHEVIKYMTKMRQHVTPTGGTDSIRSLHSIADQPDFDDQYEHELIVWAATKIRGEFSESSWQAFWQTVIDQRPVDAVTRELDLSRGAIYMARSRILKRIRAIVEEVMQ